MLHADRKWLGELPAPLGGPPVCLQEALRQVADPVINRRPPQLSFAGDSAAPIMEALDGLMQECWDVVRAAFHAPT